MDKNKKIYVGAGIIGLISVIGYIGYKKLGVSASSQKKRIRAR